MKTANLIGACVMALALIAAPDGARAEEGRVSLKVTKEPACAGEISPMQYGQFVEYLADLVPGMVGEGEGEGGRCDEQLQGAGTGGRHGFDGKLRGWEDGLRV